MSINQIRIYCAALVRPKKIVEAYGTRPNSVTGHQAEITRYARLEDRLYLSVLVLEPSSCRMQRDSTHALLDPCPIWYIGHTHGL